MLRTDSHIRDTDWYERINGLFLCYDVTDKESFSDIESTFWWEVRPRILPEIRNCDRMHECQSCCSAPTQMNGSDKLVPSMLVAGLARNLSRSTRFLQRLARISAMLLML